MMINILAVGDISGSAGLEFLTAKLRGIQKEDFALFHPGGVLGKRLLTHVSGVMHKEDKIPIVSKEASVKEALFEMTKKGFGATCVVNDSGELIGIFTDGDLRRLLEKKGSSAIDEIITEAMTKNPITITPNRLAAEAVHIMEQKEITVLIVTEENSSGMITKTPVGILQLHDLYVKGESHLRR